MERTTREKNLEKLRRRNADDWRWWLDSLDKVGAYWPPLILLVVWGAVLLIARPYFGDIPTISQGIYIEAWGTIFDLIFVGLLLTWFGLRREKKQHIERYLEEIDDFKRWDSAEAHVRIAGNIRRLAKLGKTDLDLRGIILRNFIFQANGIKSLRGSVFNKGMNGYEVGNKTFLERDEIISGHILSLRNNLSTRQVLRG